MCIRAVFSGIKRLEREADHLPPSSDEVKNFRRFASSPPYASSCRGGHTYTDNFYFHTTNGVFEMMWYRICL
jgi:hypothetical protein